MASPNLLVAVRRTEQTANGETQYIETRVADEFSITWDQLDASQVWVIKNPRRVCIEGVSRLIPGCTLYRNQVLQDLDPVENGESKTVEHKSALFLLSPKAREFYVLKPVTSEMLIVTCSAVSSANSWPQTGFFLFKGFGKKQFTCLTTLTSESDMPGTSLVKAVYKKMGLRINCSWLKKQGSVYIKRGFNSILQTRNVVHTTVYYLHLREHQVKRALRFLEVTDVQFPVVPSSHVNMRSTGTTMMLLLYSDFLNIPCMLQHINFIQLEIMLRCCNKSLGSLPFVHDLCITPFAQHANRQLEVVL